MYVSYTYVYYYLLVRGAYLLLSCNNYHFADAIALRGSFFGSTDGPLFGTGEGPILATNVLCTGNENRLLNCNYSTATFFCSHFEDAGVLCSPDEVQNCSNGALRLAGGSNRYEGRVEVCLHGQWGTVCDDGWDSNDAAVVCRELNYITNGEHFAIGNARFGEGRGLIILDNVECVGNESALINCRAQEFGNHNCFSTEDAGVFCPCELLCAS